MSRLKRLLTSLLRSELICYVIFKLRFFYYVRLLRSVRTYENENFVQSHKYSTDMLVKGRTSNRPLKLIRPLSAIDTVKFKGKTLSIGCRFETELLYLIGYGFKKDGLKGLDMISYSPWVDTGNMHDLPYSEDVWDTVILGWVLPYSNEPNKAVSEVVRVTKNGGLVAIGLSYYPEAQLEQMKKTGNYVAKEGARMQTAEQLISLFGQNVDKVYWQHDPPSNQEGTCSVIFSIKK